MDAESMVHTHMGCSSTIKRIKPCLSFAAMWTKLENNYILKLAGHRETNTTCFHSFVEAKTVSIQRREWNTGHKTLGVRVEIMRPKDKLL